MSRAEQVLSVVTGALGLVAVVLAGIGIAVMS